MRGAAVALILLASCTSDPAAPDSGTDRPDALPADDAGVEHDAGADAGELPDAAPIDADVEPDAAFPDASCVATSTTVVLTSTTPPQFLSQTGLYFDIARKTLAGDVRPFQPQHVLWADGADKQRWVSLPDCETIDTSDLDHWNLPVGTKFFKEFSLNGVRLETRLVAKIGPGEDDFIFAAYAWNDEETEAEFTRFGRQNVKGTMHNIPGVSLCKSCHTHLPERALGFGAIQLSHALPGVNLQTLIDEGRLTHPPQDAYQLAGDPTAVAAVGYLHANCGHCHFADVEGGIEFNDPFDLRLRWDLRTIDEVPAMQTAVGVMLEKLDVPGLSLRIDPGEPDTSGVVVRMSMRGNLDQMPPIATKIVDPTGLDLVRMWISEL
jgi:hypothetical protein